MTHVDDLKRGDWITVIYDTLEDHVEHLEYSGTVARILEIDLPFICIERHGRVSAIDVRSKQVQKVGARYAKLMTERRVPRRKTKQDREEEKMQCRYCGARLAQRLYKDGANRHGKWIYVCPECGQTGDPVPL